MLMSTKLLLLLRTYIHLNWKLVQSNELFDVQIGFFLCIVLMFSICLHHALFWILIHTRVWRVRFFSSVFSLFCVCCVLKKNVYWYWKCAHSDRRQSKQTVVHSSEELEKFSKRYVPCFVFGASNKCLIFGLAYAENNRDSDNKSFNKCNVISNGK